MLILISFHKADTTTNTTTENVSIEEEAVSCAILTVVTITVEDTTVAAIEETIVAIEEAEAVVATANHSVALSVVNNVLPTGNMICTTQLMTPNQVAQLQFEHFKIFFSLPHSIIRCSWSIIYIIMIRNNPHETISVLPPS